MPQRPSSRSPLSDGDPLQKSKSRTGPVGDQAPRVRPERKSGHSRHKGTIGLVIGLAAVGLIAAMFIWGMPLLQPKPMNDEQAATQLIAAQQKEREAELKRVESRKEQRRLAKEREDAELIAADKARIKADRLAEQKYRELERKKQQEEAARKLAAKQNQENKNKHAAAKPVTKPPELQNQLAGIPDNIKLPEWKHKSSERSKETFMFNVSIQDPSKCKLDIFGTRDSGLQQGRNFECNFETIQGDVHLSGMWTVICTGSKLDRPEKVAIFQLHNTKLSFKWVTDEKNLAECLGNAGIELKAENPEETKRVSFREGPSEVPGANQNASAERILPAVKLSDSGAVRTIILLRNVLPEHLHRYVLRTEIAGLTNEHKIKILKERRDRDDVYWAAQRPAVDGIAKLDIHVAKIMSREQESAMIENGSAMMVNRMVNSFFALGTVGIKRKANFINGNGEYLAITLELFHDRPTNGLALRITQRLNEPVFSLSDGVDWRARYRPDHYRYDRLIEFKDKIVPWLALVKTTLIRGPEMIKNLRQEIRDASDAQRHVIRREIAIAENTLLICRKSLKDLADVKTWHSKVATDIEQLLEKFQINFELIRDPDSSNPEIVVTSKGSE